MAYGAAEPTVPVAMVCTIFLQGYIFFISLRVFHVGCGRQILSVWAEEGKKRRQGLL